MTLCSVLRVIEYPLLTPSTRIHTYTCIYVYILIFYKYPYNIIICKYIIVRSEFELVIHYFSLRSIIAKRRHARTTAHMTAVKVYMTNLHDKNAHLGSHGTRKHNIIATK